MKDECSETRNAVLLILRYPVPLGGGFSLRHIMEHFPPPPPPPPPSFVGSSRSFCRGRRQRRLDRRVRPRPTPDTDEDLRISG